MKVILLLTERQRPDLDQESLVYSEASKRTWNIFLNDPPHSHRPLKESEWQCLYPFARVAAAGWVHCFISKCSRLGFQHQNSRRVDSAPISRSERREGLSSHSRQLAVGQQTWTRQGYHLLPADKQANGLGYLWTMALLSLEHQVM